MAENCHKLENFWIFPVFRRWYNACRHFSGGGLHLVAKSKTSGGFHLGGLPISIQQSLEQGSGGRPRQARRRCQSWGGGRGSRRTAPRTRWPSRRGPARSGPLLGHPTAPGGGGGPGRPSTDRPGGTGHFQKKTTTANWFPLTIPLLVAPGGGGRGSRSAVKK